MYYAIAATPSLRNRCQDLRRLLSGIVYILEYGFWTPMDFFLWGHLKGQVYKEGPESLCDLKREITKAVRAVPADMCRRAIASAAKRAAPCLSREGGHFEHLL